jgi:RHS repeat-associated protein
MIGEYNESGEQIQSYGYRPGSTWTTDPLFLKENSAYYFYQNDRLGTPQKINTVSGALVWAAKYSAFGEADIDPTSTVMNNFRFAGQYEDAETGLYYNWHRYYDPTTGKYIKADPIGLKGGLNLYKFAKANPQKYGDPKGLFCGPGDIGDWFVPDQPAGYYFGDCCDAHDKCYGVTDEYCGYAREQCDEEILNCMIRSCQQYPDVPGRIEYPSEPPSDHYEDFFTPKRSECEKTAKIYHWFVNKIGSIRFNHDRVCPSP